MLFIDHRTKIFKKSIILYCTRDRSQRNNNILPNQNLVIDVLYLDVEQQNQYLMQKIRHLAAFYIAFFDKDQPVQKKEEITKVSFTHCCTSN